MGRSSGLGHTVLLFAMGSGVIACGLDPTVSMPNVPASLANGGATVTGGGATAGTDTDEVTEFGDTPSSANAAGAPNSDFTAGGYRGGTDSGGAPSRGAGGIGGAIMLRGGAAGAGGFGGGAQAGAGGRGGVFGKAGAAGAAPVEPAGGSSDRPPVLFFSEYAEGSSSNKALEIAATQRSLLDGCKVAAYFNGAGTPSVVATLTGVLEAGAVLTLCTSSLQGTLGTVCAQVGRLTFNGNDAIALACNGTILDVIGQIGVDPGTAWGTGTLTTVDHTLRRKCSVTHGDDSGLNAFDPSLEWEAFPVDTWSGLGQRGC